MPRRTRRHDRSAELTENQTDSPSVATEERETPANGVENGERPAFDEASIQALIAERDGYKNELLRTAADFSNFRRRTEQDFASLKKLANRELLLQLLDVIDDFGRALTSVPAEQRESSWVSGTAMIEKKLRAILDRSGVAAIEALGQPFDPALHEAVASDPDGDGSTVVEVYRHGYRLGDGLLRPAMVKVGSSAQAPVPSAQFDA